VSGSSGRLVIESAKKPDSQVEYPGQVFADKTLDYAEAMKQFVAQSAGESTASASKETDVAPSNLEIQKRQLREEEATLRVARRQVRHRRKQEDAAWQTLKAEHKAQQQQRAAAIAAGNRPPWGSQTVATQNWKQLRKQRHNQLEQRKVENQQWTKQREQFRQQAKALPLVTVWIAILVITDNCTRQCLGLPLFVAGARVTAEMIVSALTHLLPAELQFLISDRGTHFKANVFQQLAIDNDFIHVVIARHRPQSNGIAERFIRTLKEWLCQKQWESDAQLNILLKEFQHEYNDRPHQGLPIPGLSPNEFANRV
jgi:transposase InsO family protein